MFMLNKQSESESGLASGHITCHIYITVTMQWHC